MKIRCTHPRPFDTRRQSRGFSLLEVILALGVFVVMMTGIVAIMRDFTEREVARSTAAYMTNIMTAMTDILSNPTNFLTLYHASVEAGGAYELIVDGSAGAPTADNIMREMSLMTTGMGGTVVIAPTSRLNPNFTDVSPLRSRVRILLRPANPAGTAPALEVLVVTRDPRPYSVIQKAASAGHMAGGFIDSYAGKGNARIRNAFAGWELNISSGIGVTNWYTNDLPENLDARLDGSFLAYYSFFSYSTVTSDYLFRVLDPHPSRELNTMYVPLNMNGNNVLGVDDLNIGNDSMGTPFVAAGGFDPLCDGTRLCVNGTAIVKGSAVVGSNMTVRGNAMIGDSATVNALRIENAMSDTERLAYGAQGHLMVDSSSSGSTNDIVTVRTTALFEDGAVVQAGNMGDVYTIGLTMPPGGTYTTGTGLAHRISGSAISANQFHAEGPVRAGAVTGGNTRITATNPAARTGVIDVNNMTHMQIGETATPTTAVAPAQVPRLNVQRLSISRFGACDDCPR